VDLATFHNAAVSKLDGGLTVLLVGEGYETEALGAIVTLTTNDTDFDELAALEDVLHALLINDVGEIADIGNILGERSVVRSTTTTREAARTTALLLLSGSRSGSRCSTGRSGSLLALAERTLARERTTSDLDNDGSATELLAVKHLNSLCDFISLLQLNKGVEVVLNATILLDSNAFHSTSRSDESANILSLASGRNLADEHDTSRGSRSCSSGSSCSRCSGCRSLSGHDLTQTYKTLKGLKLK